MNFYILAVCKIVKALDFNFLAFYWDALTEASFLHICLYDSPLLIDAGFVILNKNTPCFRQCEGQGEQNGIETKSKKTFYL